MALSMFLIEAALREERVERKRNRRRLRNQLNIEIIPDSEFVGNYRLSRQLFQELCQEIIPLLPLKARRHGIDPTIKICDSNCHILNVDACYGGATHDAFIWRKSEIKSHLECLQDEKVYLLGDSGYPQREYMMTPIDGAVEDSPEGRYNSLQKRARSTIERTFGILKGRWRCLLAARKLHYCPETAGKIILACCVLHNLCIKDGIEVPELTEDELQFERNRQVISTPAAVSATQALQAGRRSRKRLMQILEINRYESKISYIERLY